MFESYDSFTTSKYQVSLSFKKNGNSHNMEQYYIFLVVLCLFFQFPVNMRKFPTLRI